MLYEIYTTVRIVVCFHHVRVRNCFNPRWPRWGFIEGLPGQTKKAKPKRNMEQRAEKARMEQRPLDRWSTCTCSVTGALWLQPFPCFRHRSHNWHRCHMLPPGLNPKLFRNVARCGAIVPFQVPLQVTGHEEAMVYAYRLVAARERKDMAPIVVWRKFD